jgi:formate-dependent nitrite reductase membrane component NrfD
MYPTTATAASQGAVFINSTYTMSFSLFAVSLYLLYIVLIICLFSVINLCTCDRTGHPVLPVTFIVQGTFRGHASTRAGLRTSQYW